MKAAYTIQLLEVIDTVISLGTECICYDLSSKLFCHFSFSP